MNFTTSHSTFTNTAFAAWLAAVTLVFGALGVYGSRQGTEALPPRHWPADSRLEHSADSSTLLVFVHPECPCSRATLNNLKTITLTPSLSIVLVCVGDERSPNSEVGHFASVSLPLTEWEKHSNVSLTHDIDHEEAKRFRANTSGHCLLFDAQGKLQFSGGITSSRGHQGANAGLASLRAVLDGQSFSETYPVFGCPLFTEPNDPTPKQSGESVNRLLQPTCFKGSCRV